jgi:hypothetical protein
MIPAVIGFMALVVVFDLSSRFTHRIRRTPKESQDDTEQRTD